MHEGVIDAHTAELEDDIGDDVRCHVRRCGIGARIRQATRYGSQAARGKLIEATSNCARVGTYGVRRNAQP